MNEWAKDPMNKEAWVEIMKQSKEKITFNPLEKDIEDILGVGNVLSLLNPTVSMNQGKDIRVDWLYRHVRKRF